MKNGRNVLESRLVKENGRYHIDFEHMEKAITPSTKMFILCSPIIPWDVSLQKRNWNRQLLVVAASPTKTFNVPGVILSYLVIPNEEMRKKLQDDIDRIGMHNPTVFAVAAAEKAYTECDTWYEEMLAYINENESFTRTYFAENMPGFHIYPREGTFLLWMDYDRLHCTEEELEKWFIEKAHVSVYMGSVFGEEGRGYIRVNIASPRELLKQAYERMADVYEELQKKKQSPMEGNESNAPFIGQDNSPIKGAAYFSKPCTQSAFRK